MSATKSTLGAGAGLCDSCRWQKVVRNTRGSRFSLCRHPDLPKYPPLPVLECPGYAERRPDDAERN